MNKWLGHIFLGFFIVLFLVFLSSCSTLKDDPSMPAIDANYPTAEFYACDSHFHGLGTCAIPRGAAMDELKLSVQGYYTGTMRVYSSDCDYDQTVSYINSERVQFSVPGSMNQPSCTYGITVSPTYPNQQKQAIEIHSFRAYLRLRGVNPEQWLGKASRIPEGQSDLHFELPVSFSGTRRMVLAGCGITFDGQVGSANGMVLLSLAQHGFSFTQQKCALEGIIVGPTAAQDLLFSWLILVYNKKFAPLGIPALNVASSKLQASADANVSILSLDSDYEIASTHKFKFDPSQAHTIRALTTAGRSVVGDFSPQLQTWKWISQDE